MNFGTGFAIYFLFWWLCLFVVLPFGVRSQLEGGNVISGTEPGAPQKTYLWRKLLINTLLSGTFFALYYYITVTLGYSFADIPSPFPQDR